MNRVEARIQDPDGDNGDNGENGEDDFDPPTLAEQMEGDIGREGWRPQTPDSSEQRIIAFLKRLEGVGLSSQEKETDQSSDQ